MYWRTDKFRKGLKTKVRNEFNYLSVMAFDELNVIQTKTVTTEMYERLLEYNSTEYKAIVRAAREYALSFLTDSEKATFETAIKRGKNVAKSKANEDFDSGIVESVLDGYNLVTGYLYKREAERKRLRLAEEMLTARQFSDRQKYDNGLKKAANYWFTQSGQYAIDMEDTAVKEVWEQAGIQQVMWVSERDNRVCHTCRELDGQIFDIDNVPGKQHYNCRCTIKPVRVES